MNTLEFFNGYVDALLCSSVDDDGEPLDLGGYQVSPEALARCLEGCTVFTAAAAEDLALYATARTHSMVYSASECAGHDFWLTRAGHGIGFWDRGLGELGDRLTAQCRSFPALDAYLGDDGRVYLS